MSSQVAPSAPHQQGLAPLRCQSYRNTVPGPMPGLIGRQHTTSGSTTPVAPRRGTAGPERPAVPISNRSASLLLRTVEELEGSFLVDAPDALIPFQFGEQLIAGDVPSGGEEGVAQHAGRVGHREPAFSSAFG